jgi:mycothiol system anti-sigma-R factor
VTRDSASGAGDKNVGGDAELQLDCSAVMADIWLMLDGECAPDTRARLQQHLDSCQPCLAHYGIESELKALIGRKCGGDAAPDGLRERLRIQIRQQTTIVTRTDPQP